MRVAICDDESKAANILKRLVEDSFYRLNAKVEISIFLSGSRLLADIDKFEAVFLDVEMPEPDGFEVGKIISVRNPDCRIIMATARIERVKESFKIGAFRFVTKPFDVEEVDEAVRALSLASIGEETIAAYYNRIRYDVPQKSIQYIMAFSGYSELMVGGKIFRLDESLNDLERQLDPRLLIRIHKKYIVNMKYIKDYKNDSVWIEDKEFPVSRRKRKEFEKNYLEFELNGRG